MWSFSLGLVSDSVHSFSRSSPASAYAALVFPVPESWRRRAWLDEATYRRDHRRSLDDPQGWSGNSSSGSVATCRPTVSSSL